MKAKNEQGIYKVYYTCDENGRSYLVQSPHPDNIEVDNVISEHKTYAAAVAARRFYEDQYYGCSK